MQKLLKYIPHILAIFCSAIFLDSLRFKFTDHPNTQEIFGRLNEWAATLGAQGLFSQYVIGTAELIAASCLLLGMVPKLRPLQGLGALIGLAVMSGAISFHLFTPLGIDPNNDGGGLFMAACAVWASCAALVFLRRKDIARIGCALGRSLKAEAGTGSRAFD